MLLKKSVEYSFYIKSGLIFLGLMLKKIACGLDTTIVFNVQCHTTGIVLKGFFQDIQHTFILTLEKRDIKIVE